jgi:hypothetical protein
MISWGGIVKSLTQSIVWREYFQYFHYYNLVGMVTNQIEWGIINQSIVGNPFHLTESRDDRGSWKLFRSLLIVIVRKLSHLKLGCTIAVSGTHIFTHIFPMFKVSEDSYPWKHQRLDDSRYVGFQLVKLKRSQALEFADWDLGAVQGTWCIL